MVKIRLATAQDFDEIYRIFKAVIAKGDTYINRAETTRQEIEAKW